MYCINKKEGFTIIEMLVVLAIMVVLAILVISGYQEGRPRLAVERATESFINDLHRARQRSLSSMLYEDGADFIGGGHGIKINQSNNYYTFYAGQGEEKEIEQIQVEGLVVVHSVAPASSGVLTIFYADDGKVYFNNILASGNAEVVFAAKDDDSITMKIQIDSNGSAKIIYE